MQQRWISILAPAEPPFISQKQSQRKGTIITVTQIDPNSEVTSITELDKTLYHTSVALVANTSNWRKVAKDLIGDEPVSYSEKSKKDTLRRFPIINIMSTDKSALDRVLTKAAEVE